MDESKLLKNIQLIHNSADLVFNNQDYTSATILYFKTLLCVLDYILLKRLGKAPKDHTERLRMLEESQPNLFELLDKYFKVYRDTYSISIDKQICEEIRKNVKRIIEEYKI